MRERKVRVLRITVDAERCDRKTNDDDDNKTIWASMCTLFYWLSSHFSHTFRDPSVFSAAAIVDAVVVFVVSLGLMAFDGLRPLNGSFLMEYTAKNLSKSKRVRVCMQKIPLPIAVYVCERRRHKEREGIKSIVLAISKSRFFFRFLFFFFFSKIVSQAMRAILYFFFRTFDQTVHDPPTLALCTICSWMDFFLFFISHFLTPSLFRSLSLGNLAYDPVFSRELSPKKSTHNETQTEKRKENSWANKQQQLRCCCCCLRQRVPHARDTWACEPRIKKTTKKIKKEANGQERTFGTAQAQKCG